MPLPASLAPKSPGQLIKAEDWNALVAGVNAIETTLATAIADIDGRLGTVEAGVADMRTDIDALLANSFRITLETTRTNYAIGEVAEITATVRDLRGDVPAPVEGERPWVDFVATWGELRPMAGFIARAGVGERSISVQTNAQGIARARLSAEIVDDLTEDTEFEFSAFLNTVVDEQDTRFADLVLQANTPSDQPLQQAYQFVQTSYEGAQSGGVRKYVDSYYYRNAAHLSGKIVPGYTNQRRERWRDHHITVLAFGKADSDPRTADAARGSNSIQMNFRDWIGPWIIVDYLPSYELEVLDIVDVFQPAITNDFAESANILTGLMQDRVRGAGLLGKTRQYEAMRDAFDVLESSQPVPFMQELKTSMKATVGMQQAFQQSEVATPGGDGGEMVLQAFTDTAVRAGSKVAGVGAQVNQFEVQLEQVQASMATQVTTVQQSLTALGGRLDATLAEGGQLQQIRSGLNVVTDQVMALRGIGDPSIVTERINFISSLDNRLARLERGSIE